MRCPIPHGAVGGWTRAKVLGGEWALFPCVGATLHLSAACVGFKSSVLTCLQFLVELPSSLLVLGNVHRTWPCLWDPLVSESKIIDKKSISLAGHHHQHTHQAPRPHRASGNLQPSLAKRKIDHC